MVNYRAARLDAVFSALADPTRRGILAALVGGGRPVTELARPFDMSLPGFMKHLDVLEDAGLVEREKEGRVVNCMLTAGPMREARDWLERYRLFWEARLDALERYLSRGIGPLPLKARGALPAPPHDRDVEPLTDKESKPWMQSRKSPRSRSSASSRPRRTRSGARSRNPRR
ncbi:MAG TPA: metalloregulator ArsR/SmtB family transcription factor [Burkholderiales bacterium]|nr:metalloregulator ArsR/SmtB family transcription factor [Burkholderiales bacterium]